MNSHLIQAKTTCILTFFQWWVVSTSISYLQVKLVSWNIEKLGKSKSDDAIKFMAQTVKSFDIVAIQKVVAGYGGSQAAAKLAKELYGSGVKWDYAISDPAASSGYKTERYAFLWKTAIVKKLGKPWLEKHFRLEIDRKPFYCLFEYKNKSFILVTFHAITKEQQPKTELKYFQYFPDLYPELNLIFAGDFNCMQFHTVSNPLKKRGYVPLLVGQKTTLKKRIKRSEYLASKFDNMFY
jgi:deoxyribonuclease-1-like protein